MPRIYAFRYMPHVIYLDTYTGLPYIPKYTYIQLSHVEALTNSFPLRRKALHFAALLEPKSGSQTVQLQLRDSPWASTGLESSRHARDALLSHGGSPLPRLSTRLGT